MCFSRIVCVHVWMILPSYWTVTLFASFESKANIALQIQCTLESTHRFTQYPRSECVYMLLARWIRQIFTQWLPCLHPMIRPLTNALSCFVLQLTYRGLGITALDLGPCISAPVSQLSYLSPHISAPVSQLSYHSSRSQPKYLGPCISALISQPPYLSPSILAHISQPLYLGPHISAPVSRSTYLSPCISALISQLLISGHVSRAAYHHSRITSAGCRLFLCTH